MRNLVNQEKTTMDDSPSEFVMWLRQRAAAAGYDPEVRGSVSALAKASDMDIGQTSRALRDQAVPSPEALRRLAKVLGVTTLEMFLKAGVICPDDIAELLPSPGQDFSMYRAPAAADLDWNSVGAQMGVPPENMGRWIKVVEAVTEAFEEGASN